ncbi:hypothetical protein HMPREF3218_0201697 [Prevotella bivia]|nr:hypothetical protein HMPREF3218_0201697 [Prevotella bivia]
MNVFEDFFHNLILFVDETKRWIVQASAIQACLNIAECSLSYAKIVKIVRNTSK